MAKRLKSGAPIEDTIQITVMDWVSLHPDISDFVIHIANEGKRSPRYGAKMKRMGLRKGVSDILITMARHGYHGAWIEIKSESGVVSLDQKRFHKQQTSQGYYCEVTIGIDASIAAIEWYCYGN